MTEHTVLRHRKSGTKTIVHGDKVIPSDSFRRRYAVSYEQCACDTEHFKQPTN